MVTAFAILLALTALLAWVNERFVRIPTTVGVTLSGAIASIVLILLDDTGIAPQLRGLATRMLQTLDFTDFVLNGILSILLFAGAMSLDARQMLRQGRSVMVLAFAATLISTVLIGLGAYVVFALVGLKVPLLWAMLFGALVSPTDPVAVLDLLSRTPGVPQKIKILIAGESLFNDGVGVVFYLVIAGLLGISQSGHEASITGALLVFVQEALGGMAFGAALGGIAWWLCKEIDNHVVEILLCLAMVIGGYLAAAALGLSGPLAMVVAGLIMSAGSRSAFHTPTQHLVEGFWETLDQVLNILLFAFIGLDVLLTETTGPQMIATALLIVVALVARFVSVAIPFALVRSIDGYGPYTVRLLTWGGLRGGIAISLALGLPQNEYRPALVTATYGIVLFTIAVQGLTVMPLIRKAADAAGPDAVSASDAVASPDAG